MLRMRRKESKEIAKNAKDDDEKREKGGIEKGCQWKQAFRMANRSKGEIGLWTLECCALTDNCGNTATTHSLHYTNDNKHVNSQRHSHSLV